MKDYLQNHKMLMVVDPDSLRDAIQQAVSDAMNSRQPNEEAFITHAEAEKRLGVCRTTLWHWNDTGYLRKYHRDKKVIYRLSDVKRIKRGEAFFMI